MDAAEGTPLTSAPTQFPSLCQVHVQAQTPPSQCGMGLDLYLIYNVFLQGAPNWGGGYDKKASKLPNPNMIPLLSSNLILPPPIMSLNYCFTFPSLDMCGGV